MQQSGAGAAAAEPQVKVMRSTWTQEETTGPTKKKKKKKKTMEKPFSLLRFVIFSSVRHLNLFRLLLPIHEIGSHLNAVDLKHLVLPLSVMKTKKIPFNFLIFFRDFSPYETEIIRKMESNKTWWTTYFSQKNKTKFTDHFFFWGLCNWWPLMQGISMITAVSAVYRFDLAITSHNWFLFSFDNFRHPIFSSWSSKWKERDFPLKKRV